jgi:hypothetical protein
VRRDLGESLGMELAANTLALAAKATELSTNERDGLWLIAVGAASSAVQVAVQGPLAGLSGRPVGGVSTPRDRIAFAFGFVGALLVGSGSALVAFAHLPRWWVALSAAAGALVVFYLFAAWRLWLDCRRLLHESRQALARNVNDAALQWNVSCSERRASLWWCLRRPFISWSASEHDCVNALGPRP